MLNSAGIVLIIIILFFLICFLRSQSLENFISLIDENIPSNCYNYLVSNGNNFFLLNTKKVIDGITNPLTFNTKKEALHHLSNNKCPIDIPFVDLVTNKKLEDPTVSYERECNRKIATNLFDLNICSEYGDESTDTIKYKKKMKEMDNDKTAFANYNAEKCMMDKVMKDEPDLDDTNFKTYFSKYFDNLNSNIDEKYLYVTN